ncbi:MAG: pyridoxine 5'-phosphate synthase [Candidatus Latescibacterota bacterium]|nr:MAG: pyridoxine 5'-phosphate synthase [Candidatus Latescibacterota bacterium]RKY72922.1 MAG: pyridoxine 5'-phosphate synthase [Candidatus Latescibacterota bacterium]
MPKLSVNVDHVATLRQARKAQEPDPVAAAVLVELAGADGVTVHLREDRRHINDRDLRLLRHTVKTHLNMEMAATEEMVSIAREIMPDMVTLVPEKREELTTEGGLDVLQKGKELEAAISTLHSSGILVSLFVDPDLKQVREAARIGADYIELHTGEYANATDLRQETEQWEKIRDMAMAGEKLGLGINAGHGLTYQNISRIVQIKQIEEVSIGHSIIARAVLVGLETAIREMLALVRR